MNQVRKCKIKVSIKFNVMKTKNSIWLYSIIILAALSMVAGGCEKDEGDNFNPTETVTDFDGNVYHVVKIGMQVWMVENLKVTHYNNGDPIDIVSDSAIWNILETPAYCNYDNNEANSNTYGRLYNWYAVSDPRKTAPPGWHIATDAEWTTLINFLGGSDVAGGKMKTLGTTHWSPPNSGATNSSGFSALPGGVNKGYQDLHQFGYFWSTTSSSGNTAWYWYLGFNFSEIRHNSGTNFLGFSVRCVKD